MSDPKQPPDRIWAWSFNDWANWGGYARSQNRHPLDDRERATGAEYVRSDLCTPATDVSGLLEALRLVAAASTCKTSRDIARAELAKWEGR